MIFVENVDYYLLFRFICLQLHVIKGIMNSKIMSVSPISLILVVLKEKSVVLA